MKPITRKEMLMAKAAGQSVPDITPVTREEYFLNQIAESGGGGGGGGDSTMVKIDCTTVYDMETQAPTITLDASYNDIKAMIIAGKAPYFVSVYEMNFEEDEHVFHGESNSVYTIVEAASTSTDGLGVYEVTARATMNTVAQMGTPTEPIVFGGGGK